MGRVCTSAAVMGQSIIQGEGGDQSLQGARTETRHIGRQDGHGTSDKLPPHQSSRSLFNARGFPSRLAVYGLLFNRFYKL